jgi:hypothetical protein
MTGRTAQRERAIQAVIRTGRAPGRNVKWSEFCDFVRAAAWVRETQEGFPRGCAQSRLPDPRLARDQHDASGTGFCLRPPAAEQINLLFASDERGIPRAQCLEPAQSFSRAQYSPGALRRAKAAQLLARGRAQPLLDGKNVRLIIEGRGGYTVGVNFEKSK